jgi:transcriptional regulator with XRE-family HTH domain
LLRKLRANRTQAQFGELLGVPKNTVWRWEAGRSKPDRRHASRLAALAAGEGFLADWKLVGSIVWVGDLKAASRAIAKAAERRLRRSGRAA